MIRGSAAQADERPALDAVVVVAMESEEAPFVALADGALKVDLPGVPAATLLTLRGRAVLLVRSGIGLVNASSSAAVALAAYPTRALVSAGSAGGLGVGVRVGDVVVGSSYVYSGADARAFGYALGQVPGMPATFAADEVLHRAAVGAGPGLAWSGEGIALRVLDGAIISGDVFVDAERVAAVRESFPDALATDMESAALAHVAHRFGAPFLSVRGISDLCSPVEAGEFATHVDDAAARSAAVVAAALTS